MNFIKSVLVISLMATGVLSKAEAAIYYVKPGAGGNGSSWSSASNLDTALNAASRNPGQDQIWVAAGTYKPTIKYRGTYLGNEGNLVTFKLPSNVAIYGGFRGTETALSNRNPDLNPTILSGDLSGNDINTPSNALNFKGDNAWHVITADGVTGVVLDGLIVRDGFAAGPDAGTALESDNFVINTLDYTHAAGGGLLVRQGSQITLNNMRFEYNASDSHRAGLIGPSALGSPPLASGGGAVAAADDGTIVTINNSSFDHNTGNYFASNGGALNALAEASYTVSNSTFTNNTANRIGGAIHAKDAGTITVVNSIILNNNVIGSNIGDESGGGIGTINTNLSVSKSYFENNSSGPIAGGGGIFFHIPFDDGEMYQLNVDNSIFNKNNGASFGGGGIIIFGVNPHVGSKTSITNSVFTNNTGSIGGAVYVDSIPTIVTNSGFVSNQAWLNGGAILGSNFGDAIFGVTNLSDRTMLQISNSVFMQNSIIGIPATAIFQPVDLLNLFALFQSSTNGIPLAGVTEISPGGGAIASEFEGNLNISKSLFLFNTAPNGNGGALLVGGTKGFAGTTPLGMNQAYATLKQALCFGNSATLGGNNTAVLDPNNIGNSSNGVKLVSDGSCP